MKNIFIHHVFFWLKDPKNPQVRAKFEKGLQKLVTISEIQSFHLGVPASTDRGVIDSTYTYSLLTIFKNKADQDIYQEHPTHLAFIDECEDLWKKVLVYDSVDMQGSVEG
jgi:hypothetical protein